MFIGIKKDPPRQQVLISPIQFRQVLPDDPQQLILIVVHRLVLVFPLTGVVRVERIENILRKRDLDQFIDLAVDVAVMRHVDKRPLRSLGISDWHVRQVRETAHGTLLIAAYLYTPLFEASDAEAALSSRILIVEQDT